MFYNIPECCVYKKLCRKFNNIKCYLEYGDRLTETSKLSEKSMCECCWGSCMVPTCAALGKRGLVTAGWTTGAAGRLGITPAVGAGAIWGIPGLGAM